MDLAGGYYFIGIKMSCGEYFIGIKMSPELEQAIWEGDVNKLCDLAGCICCCSEHTFEGCPARIWYGCRGSYTMTRVEVAEWAAHYAKYHGLTEDQFYAYDRFVDWADELSNP